MSSVVICFPVSWGFISGNQHMTEVYWIGFSRRTVASSILKPRQVTLFALTYWSYQYIQAAIRIYLPFSTMQYDWSSKQIPPFATESTWSYLFAADPFVLWGSMDVRLAYSISQEICTRFCCALLCCGYAIVHNEFTLSIYPYSSGLLCWHWGNR